MKDSSRAYSYLRVKSSHTHNIPSLRMAMIRTMKGAKSNFQIKSISKNPSCKRKLTLGWIGSNIYILIEKWCEVLITIRMVIETT
jgi:hypothetical protein